MLQVLGITSSGVGGSLEYGDGPDGGDINRRMYTACLTVAETMLIHLSSVPAVTGPTSSTFRSSNIVYLVSYTSLTGERGDITGDEAALFPEKEVCRGGP